MNIYKIKESELSSIHFPRCVCVYNCNNKFSMIEVNTDRYKGSIKMISNTYNTYDEIKKSFKLSDTIYPILFNYIIYDNISGYL